MGDSYKPEKEVVVHYRTSQNRLEDLQQIAAGSLERFPLRRLPTFCPWFPDHVQNFILKPLTRPPLISVELCSKISYDTFDPVNVVPFMYCDPTPNLLEFKPNIQTKKVEDGQIVTTKKDDFICDPQAMGESISKENPSVRSWSICTRRASNGEPIIAASEQLKDTLERLQLNLFHRGRWTILPSVCGALSLEDIWGKLSRLMRHCVLPSCNATMQRHIPEIWIFCDLRYCAHIGTLVKSELKLCGRIDFFVHKHGIILMMRLTKPTLFTNIPVTCEDRDLPGDLFSTLMREDPSTVKGAEILMLGEMLTLPQNFGNIFLGETFSSYISVHNDSNQIVKDIQVKADLQTSSQRLNLSASTAVVAELKSDSCIDDVIHHEVKEIGTHILVCAVSYTTQTGEKMYFRKFFKFQVLKPLDVKTKFYNAESDLSSVTDEVFLEAQIQNITTSPMFMEKVSLEPSMMYNVTELNSVVKDGEGLSTFGTKTYLQPMDTRQYLYCLKPKPEFAEKAGVIKGVTVIGKLDIVWKTNLGERGRLQTSQLQRMAPGYGDVRLSLETIPDTVNLEEPFDITCKITNCSERTMDLILEMCNTNAIHWCCVSGRQLGKLHPSSSLFLTLTLLSSVQGLQSVSGLRLTDTFLKRTYEYDDIAQVCVVSSKNHLES
ncbi:trafficking protein particle complex subunit 13 isoform X2 [Pseudophryne corroboree]|uniref:trafficking protein particle complex subunit 13 isoform X2 n=1 Tax=Pseudophryne corroboree TaxID=495146 RepID=UPI0030818D93